MSTSAPVVSRHCRFPLSRAAGTLFAAFSLLAFLPLPSRAGTWAITYSNTGKTSYDIIQPPTTLTPYSNNNAPTSNGASVGTASGRVDAKANATIVATLTWQPASGQTKATDPPPTTPVSIQETATASEEPGVWSGSGPAPYPAGTVDDGLQDAPTTSSTGKGKISTGSHLIQKDGSSGTIPLDKVVMSAACPQTVFANDGTINWQQSISAGVKLTVQVASLTAGIAVDQDQQVIPPAATTRFSATISGSGFTIDSVKISVDGTATAATVSSSNPNNYYIDWPQTGGNPSEHSVTATAQIHNSTLSATLNSTDSGIGRPADDIVADVHLQSIKYNSNIALNQDAVTPVPTPEITWTAGGTSPATANPAAYIQGKNVNLTLILGSSAGAALTGNATMGYLLKLQASPNTTNPATNAADPTLTLYDNTTASPTVPVSCSASTTVAATTALSGWVSSYATSFPVLTFYVEFTKIPTPTWSVLSSYNSSVGNTLYGVIATPTTPMTSPWVSVLNYACNWAKRTTSATSATTALTIGEYNAGHYNQGNPTGFTGPFLDGQEDFYPAKFINAGLTGQCNDFADFLCCVSNSIGAVALQPQRSASVNDYNNGSSFTTKPITASGTLVTNPPSSGQPVTWAYHQWTANNVFDGCLLFGGTVSPNNLALQSYHDSLVATTLHTNPIFDWDPQSPMTLNVK